ncbi:MAG: zinc-dependent metalloprotease [Actinobacteria bacterium]|nr:zinc-dependent metalloprotease [Actinomycetota bacterium]
MTDNLFDRLRRLLETPGPINWGLAREVAESVAGPAEPVDPWVAEELAELTHTAALRVAAVSPLDAAAGAVRTLDRRSWAAESVTGFAYLAEPLAAKMGGSEAGEAGPLMLPLGPALVGMQMGSMAGFLSHRVLAGFDVGLPVQGAPPSFVVPNLAAFTADHGLDERQARLWLALHEAAHRAEVAVPWVRRHLGDLVAAFVDGLRPDPAGLQERLEALQDPDRLQDLLDDPSVLSGLVAGPESEQALRRLQAFMALLEGYAEWLVERAAPGLIPEAPRLREAIDRRRAEPSPGEQMLQRMLGLDLEHHRYRRGTTFCTEVARRWGEEALARLWDGPDGLPGPAELEDPVGWAARLLL